MPKSFGRYYTPGLKPKKALFDNEGHYDLESDKNSYDPGWYIVNTGAGRENGYQSGHSYADEAKRSRQLYMEGDQTAR